MPNYSNYTDEQLEQYLAVWSDNVEKSNGASSREFAEKCRDAIRKEIEARACATS